MCLLDELTGKAGGAPRKAVREADPEVIPHDREAMSAHVRGPTYNVKAAFIALCETDVRLELGGLVDVATYRSGR